MNIDTLNYFIADGVYKLKSTSDEIIFVCECSVRDVVATLVQYKSVDGIYEKTGIKYFLNSYIQGDIKGLFLNRENYDMLGKIGSNYVRSEDGQQILGV